MTLDAGRSLGTAKLEIRCWSRQAYLEALETAAPAPAESDAQWTLSGPVSAHQAPIFEQHGGAQPGPVFQVLVADMLAKQMALERLQRHADAAASRGELALWRLRDATGRNESLQQAIAELRRLLHQGSDAAAAAAVTGDAVASLDTPALREQCRQAAGQLRLERVKNKELVKRLKVRCGHCRGAVQGMK